MTNDVNEISEKAKLTILAKSRSTMSIYIGIIQK
jgi:hypothetical protein